MVIYLAKIELNLDKKSKSAFVQRMAIINLVIVVKFFYIICKALFVSLLVTGEVKKILLRLILNYFVIIKINWHKMLQLH